jgi:hypothetical protein
MRMSTPETGSVSNHSTPRPSAHLVLIPGIHLRKLRPLSRSLRGEQIRMQSTSLEWRLCIVLCERVALQRFVFSWNAAPILQNGIGVALRRRFWQ